MDIPTGDSTGNPFTDDQIRDRARDFVIDLATAFASEDDRQATQWIVEVTDPDLAGSPHHRTYSGPYVSETEALVEADKTERDLNRGINGTSETPMLVAVYPLRPASKSGPAGTTT